MAAFTSRQPSLQAAFGIRTSLYLRQLVFHISVTNVEMKQLLDEFSHGHCSYVLPSVTKVKHRNLNQSLVLNVLKIENQYRSPRPVILTCQAPRRAATISLK